MEMDPDHVKKMSEWMRVMSASDVTSPAEFKERVHAYIKWCWEHEFRGSTLGHLNRRFGTRATHFGTKIRQIVTQFFLEGKVDLLNHKNSLVVVDLRYKEHLLPIEEDKEMPLDQAVNLVTLKRNNILEDSVRG